MKTLNQLVQIKSELSELLEDNENVEMEFVIELNDSHIKTLQEIEKLKSLYDYANKSEDYSDFYNHMHLLTYGYKPKS